MFSSGSKKKLNILDLEESLSLITVFVPKDAHKQVPYLTLLWPSHPQHMLSCDILAPVNSVRLNHLWHLRLKYVQSSKQSPG